MSWHGETANLRGASVQNVKENSLAVLDANGIAVAQHPPIDRERAVANFKAMRHALGERRLHGRLSSFLQLLVDGRGREKIHVHVASAAEGRLEFLQDKEDLAVVVSGLVPGLDVNRSHQAAVLSCGKICPCAHVRMVKAKARWRGREDDAPLSVRRNEGRTFFGGAVNIGRDRLAVPVQLFGRVRVVVDIDGDLPAFLKAQQRAGELAVVRGDRNDAIGREFDRRGGDPQGVIGDAIGRRRRPRARRGVCEPRRVRQECCSRGKAHRFQEVASRWRHFGFLEAAQRQPSQNAGARYCPRYGRAAW